MFAGGATGAVFRRRYPRERVDERGEQTNGQDQRGKAPRHCHKPSAVPNIDSLDHLQSFDARQTYFFRKDLPANCVFPHPNAEKPLEIT
jgi:hypothetical protein